MELGILQGKVTIGPIFPHEREGVPNEAPAEVYRAHGILILWSEGKKEIPLDDRGYYRTELPAGTYTVDVIPHDIGIRPGSYQQKVEIRSGQTTTVNFDLDTGIR